MFDGKLFYILITPDEDPEPVFVYQGYTLPSLALPRLVHTLLRLPASIDSHQYSAETLIKYRLCASHKIRSVPLMVGQIRFIVFDKSTPFRIFLSTEETDAQTSYLLSKTDHPTLHITSCMLSRIIAEPDYGPGLVRTYARSVADFIYDEFPTQSTAIRADLDKAAAPQKLRQLKIPKHNHNVTAPNEVPIELSGGIFQGVEHFNTLNDSGYANAVRASAHFMRVERERLHEGFPTGFHRQTMDLIIACPGLLFHLSSSGRLRNLFSEPGSNRQFKEAFLFYVRQEGYATLVIPDQLQRLLNNPYYPIFTEIWQKEINTFTAALTFQAFNEFCPVMRLPRNLYRTRGRIAMLGNLLRDGSKKEPSPASVNKLANQICVDMEEVAGMIQSDFLDGYDKKIRIVADLPLGWMRVDGIPLALRHNVSQIPTTPGGLFMGMSLMTDRRFFNIGIRQHVVVIRSFHANDPLREVLKDAIGKYSKKAGWDFDVEFIDVGNEADLIGACRKIRSPFLIFDGHGTHKAKAQVGTIRIGDMDLDVWQLRKKVAIPPIVILSCCDAAPSDRSHASITNGFLRRC